MSVSGIIDSYNADPDYYNKIYPDLIPWQHPLGQQNLGQVLAVGSNASNPTTGLPQDATDFKILGCEEIETSKVYQGNQPFLKIGEVGDQLQIKGCITKGSLLVGNGTETEEFAIPVAPLPVPPNGSVLILDSSQPQGVRWGGESGPIATITAGNNIDIIGTSANPIVAFQNPTTSNISLGAGTYIEAKDNYGTPNYTMTLDSTGFNDTYSAGSVINQEDIAVSSTGVQQILSATNTSDYVNTATLTCDTNFISDTRTSQILSAGSEKLAFASIATSVAGSQPLAGFTCSVSAPTTSPFPDITASVGMSCGDTTNPNFSLSQSAPFAVSYSTIIDKDGINSNNSGGVAPFTINSNTQPLTLTTSDALTITADNIDLSSTGRLILPSLSSGDFMDYNTGSLKIVNDSVGGTANPLLVLQNNNATTGGVVIETYKNDPPNSTGGDVIGQVSSYCNVLVAGVPTKVEMTRISSIAQGAGTGNNDGTIQLSCKVNSGANPDAFLSCNGGLGNGEIRVFKPITSGADLNTISAINTTISTTGVGSQIEFKPEATAGKIVFTGASLQSNTAGGNSGEHLVITLNGNVYKIKLELP